MEQNPVMLLLPSPVLNITRLIKQPFINLSGKGLPPEDITTTWNVYTLGLYYPNDHSTKSLSLDLHKVTLSHTPHSYYNKDGVHVNECPKKSLSSRNSFNDQDIYCPNFLHFGPIPLETSNIYNQKWYVIIRRVEYLT